MGLEVLHCKTVKGVIKELYMFAITYNLIQNAIRAYIEKSSIDTNGQLEVSSVSSPAVVTVAVGAAGGPTAALGGSVSVNSIANNLDSHIAASSNVHAVGDIAVTSSQSAPMVALAGGLGISPDGAAVGAAFAFNY